MHGARVIKVERKGMGDFARRYDGFANGSCSYFSWLNAGKQSLEVDLNVLEDVTLLKRIVEKTNNLVVVSNQVPHALEKKGLCPEQHLSTINPSLMSVQISGWGSQGQQATRKAYDLIVAAEAGLCSVTGTEDSGPSRVGVSLVDIHTGRLAYQSVLQMLLCHERQMLGQQQQRHCKLSMFDATAELMTVPYLTFTGTGHAPPRSGLKHPTIAPYGAFTCKDDKSILLSVQNEHEWKDLLRALDLSSMDTDVRFQTNVLRVQHRGELDQILSRTFSSMLSHEVLAILSQYGIASSRVSTVDDLAAHPLLRLYQVMNEFGGMVHLPCEAGMSSVELSGGVVPKLGQHNELIRGEFS